MRRVLKDTPIEDFAKPEGIVEGILIDTKTGLLARNNGTIPETEMRYEIFIEGTEGKEYSPQVKTLFDHLRGALHSQAPGRWIAWKCRAGCVRVAPEPDDSSLSVPDEGQRAVEEPGKSLLQPAPSAPSPMDDPDPETAPPDEEKLHESEPGRGDRWSSGTSRGR